MHFQCDRIENILRLERMFDKMTEELQRLKREFLKIKSMGYVKSTRKGPTGIGKTFEDLLGKKEDRLSEPDYHGIELKTKRAYTKSYITLFSATPQGEEQLQVKRLRDNYGYQIKPGSKLKCLNCSVQANCSTFVSGKYLFKLKIDWENEKVFLMISNQSFTMIEQKSYWTFGMLKERLERKLPYLALIKAWPNTINGEEYYKYYDIEFYHLKTFEEFLKLLESGTIRITFKVGIYKKGPYKNQINDKGTSFEIQDVDLFKLFDKLEV